MLVSTEIYITSLDIDLLVSCDLWSTVSKVRSEGFTITEVDGDVGPLEWDKSEFPGFNEEIALWLDTNYDKVEKKLWQEYNREVEAEEEAYQLRNI